MSKPSSLVYCKHSLIIFTSMSVLLYWAVQCSELALNFFPASIHGNWFPIVLELFWRWSYYTSAASLLSLFGLHFVQATHSSPFIDLICTCSHLLDESKYFQKMINYSWSSFLDSRVNCSSGAFFPHSKPHAVTEYMLLTAMTEIYLAMTQTCEFCQKSTHRSLLFIINLFYDMFLVKRSPNPSFLFDFVISTKLCATYKNKLFLKAWETLWKES